MFDDIDLNRIQDENARELIVRLLNLVEKLSADLRDAQVENQRLRDENNRLKGEQGKPKIKGNTQSRHRPITLRRKNGINRANGTKAARKPKSRSIGSKWLQSILPVLPEDAEFKGHEDVVVQDILLRTDNILFHKQKYYLPRPAGPIWPNCHGAMRAVWAGDQGPDVLLLWDGTSEPKILEFLKMWASRSRKANCPIC